MDYIDKKLLNYLQVGIKIIPNPFTTISDELNISELETVQRIKRLKDAGIIRRFGAVINSQKLGLESVLCGASVSDSAIDHFVQIVNAHPGVTHHYQRDSHLNMWFTLTTATQNEQLKFIQSLLKIDGVTTVLPFHRVKTYKLKVFFNMED